MKRNEKVGVRMRKKIERVVEELKTKKRLER